MLEEVCIKIELVGCWTFNGISEVDRRGGTGRMEEDDFIEEKGFSGMKNGLGVFRVL